MTDPEQEKSFTFAEIRTVLDRTPLLESQRAAVLQGLIKTCQSSPPIKTIQVLPTEVKIASPLAETSKMATNAELTDGELADIEEELAEARRQLSQLVGQRWKEALSAYSMKELAELLGMEEDQLVAEMCNRLEERIVITSQITEDRLTIRKIFDELLERITNPEESAEKLDLVVGLSLTLKLAELMNDDEHPLSKSLRRIFIKEMWELINEGEIDYDLLDEALFGLGQTPESDPFLEVLKEFFGDAYFQLNFQEQMKLERAVNLVLRRYRGVRVPPVPTSPPFP